MHLIQGLDPLPLGTLTGMSQHVPDAVRARVDSLSESVHGHLEGLREDLREIKPKLRGWLHLSIAPLTLAAGIVLVVLSPTPESRLGSEHRDLRKPIAEVDRVRRELAETRDQLLVEATDAEKLRRRLQAEHQALEEERRAVGRKLQGELEAFRRETAGRFRV